MKLPGPQTSSFIAAVIMITGAVMGAALTANAGATEFFGWMLFYAAVQAPIWLMLAVYARRLRPPPF